MFAICGSNVLQIFLLIKYVTWLFAYICVFRQSDL